MNLQRIVKNNLTMNCLCHTITVQA